MTTFLILCGLTFIILLVLLRINPEEPQKAPTPRIITSEEEFQNGHYYKIFFIEGEPKIMQAYVDGEDILFTVHGNAWWPLDMTKVKYITEVTK
jgi:hypothetical protein